MSDVGASAYERHKRLLDYEELISESSARSSCEWPRPTSRCMPVAGTRHPAAHVRDNVASLLHDDVTRRWRRSATPAVEPVRPAGQVGRRPIPPAIAAQAALSQANAGAARPLSSQGKMHPNEFQALCDLIGSKAAQRYRTVSQTMRQIDQDKNGMVERGEIHQFFRHFNLPQETADNFFNHLRATDANQVLDFSVLCNTLGPFIVPGYSGSRHSLRRSRSASRMPQNERLRRAEIEELADLIGSKAHQRFGDVRACFRSVDEDKDGTISRVEVVKFIERLGLPRSTAEHAWNLLLDGGDGYGRVHFLKFMDTFGPIIQPGYYTQNPAYRRDEPLPSQTRTPRPNTARAAFSPQHPISSRRVSFSRRPQSARGRIQTSGGSVTLRAVRAAKDRADDEASLASVSTPSSIGSGGQRSASSQSSAYLYDRSHAEVCCAPRGSFPWIRSPPKKPVHNRTFDSSNVRNRLGGDTAACAERLTTSRSWGPTAWKAALMRQEPPAGVPTTLTVRERRSQHDAPTICDTSFEELFGGLAQWSARPRSSSVEKRSECHDHLGSVLLTPGHRGVPVAYFRRSRSAPSSVIGRHAFSSPGPATRPASGFGVPSRGVESLSSARTRLEAIAQEIEAIQSDTERLARQAV